MPKESDQEKLYSKEAALARQQLTGSNSGNGARKALGLPSNVRGLVIVDVGAGGSGLAANLLEGGAIVRAVDPIYAYPARIDGFIDRANRKIFQQVPPNLLETVRAGVLRGAEEFRVSFKQRPEVYVPGYATHLPLEDGFADHVVSFHAITELAIFPDLLEATLIDCLRVAKKGGVVSISPWHTPRSLPRQQTYIRQHGQMVEKLKKMGLRNVEVKTPSDNFPFILKVVK